MKNINIIITILIMLSSFFGVYSLAGMGDGDSVSHAALRLSEIRDNLEFWQNHGESLSSEAKGELSNSIVRKVMLVRSVMPEFRELKGKSLETFCLLAEPKGFWEYITDEQLKALAWEYVSSQKQVVLKEIASVQKNLLGKGCYLTPQANS